MKLHSKHVKKWRELNPDKVKAHMAINNAVRNNRIKKLPCMLCGNPEVQAHHTDYTKRLDVQWLCSKCHSEKHNTNKKPQRVKVLIELNGVRRNPKFSYYILYPKVVKLREAGLHYSEIGKILNIATSTAYKIYNNKTY